MQAGRTAAFRGEQQCAPACAERLILLEKSCNMLLCHDYGAGDNATPVARHNRPSGRPWVVISKTLGEPVSGGKRPVRLPCSHVHGGRAARHEGYTRLHYYAERSFTEHSRAADR